MISCQNALSTQRKPQASKKRDQGMLHSLIYSAAVQFDSHSQKSSLKVLRKNSHNEVHTLKVFHDF